MIACAPRDQQPNAEDEEPRDQSRQIQQPRHEQLSWRRPGKCQQGDGGNESGGTEDEHEYSTERKSWRCHVLSCLEVRHIIRGVASVCHQWPQDKALIARVRCPALVTPFDSPV